MRVYIVSSGNNRTKHYTISDLAINKTLADIPVYVQIWINYYPIDNISLKILKLNISHQALVPRYLRIEFQMKICKICMSRYSRITHQKLISRIIVKTTVESTAKKMSNISTSYIIIKIPLCTKVTYKQRWLCFCSAQAMLRLPQLTWFYLMINMPF